MNVVVTKTQYAQSLVRLESLCNGLGALRTKVVATTRRSTSKVEIRHGLIDLQGLPDGDTSTLLDAIGGESYPRDKRVRSQKFSNSVSAFIPKIALCQVQRSNILIHLQCFSNSGDMVVVHCRVLDQFGSNKVFLVVADVPQE